MKMAKYIQKSNVKVLFFLLFSLFFIFIKPFVLIKNFI